MTRLKIALILSSLAFLPMTQIAHADIMLKPTTKITAQNVNQIPSDESLKKLVQVQQMDKTFTEMFDQTKGVVSQAVQQSIKENLADQKLTATQQQQLQEAVNDFMQKSLEAQNQPEMREQLINAFIETAKTTYTQAEVNAMIDFYGSSIGRSVIAKQSQFGKTYLEQIMPIVMANQQQTMKQLMPEFQQKLEKITQSSPKATKTVKHKTIKK